MQSVQNVFANMLWLNDRAAGSALLTACGISKVAGVNYKVNNIHQNLKPENEECDQQSAGALLMSNISNIRAVRELEVPYPLSGQIIENKYPCPQSGCELLLGDLQDLETLKSAINGVGGLTRNEDLSLLYFWV